MTKDQLQLVYIGDSVSVYGRTEVVSFVDKKGGVVEAVVLASGFTIYNDESHALESATHYPRYSIKD